ncbi:MAG: alpha/beta fold hydrolase, partial [Limnohabitans sp.]
MRQLPHIENFLRTPEERFQNLPDFTYQPNYTEIGGLRIAYIDEGPKDGPVVLLMHGEPAWSFLYRKMIPVLVEAGMRVLVPDQVGFGRTDKPTQRSDYTYENHVQWMSAWLESVDANNITLFCQDWGSLIGLRMVAEMPERFARIALSNGGLPTGKEK